MKMKELECRSGVNREVIRIMLREGLLPAPVRSGRNAAEYGEAHVRAIASVRDLQQKGRLTLRQIRSAMNGDGTPLAGSATAFPHLEELLAGRFDLTDAPMVSLQLLLQRYPEAQRDADTFRELGMLEIVDGADGPQLSLTDARLIEIWGEIRNAGFVEEKGFPPDKIEFYREAAEFIAEKEAEVFFKAGGGAIEESHAASMLHTALPLMLDFLGLLRVKAFMRHMQRHREAGRLED